MYLERSMGMGEPMEVLMAAFTKYLPLIDSGFLLTRAISMESALLSSCATSNFLRPILELMALAWFTLNSMRPCLLWLTCSIRFLWSTSVPLLALGISPLGPKILASLFRAGRNSWVQMILSNSMLPLANSASISSEPMASAPTFSSSSWNSESAKTQILTSLPVPAGRMQVPLMFWSPLVGSTLSLTLSSTLSWKFLTLDCSLANLKASESENSFSSLSIFIASSASSAAGFVVLLAENIFETSEALKLCSFLILSCLYLVSLLLTLLDLVPNSLACWLASCGARVLVNMRC
mmetsp:Transcript_18076/g.30848  ORF Transcript_18076/g.30848 Transcript_18076/m.30848 type:complete len:293 (-) Transcript_18076:117-995(-)